MRRPDRVSVVPDATRLEYPTAIGYLYESEEALGQTLTIDAQYMVFDKFYNPLNPWRGLAPIHAVREGITIDLFAQAWSKSFLHNNARPDFAIIAPQGITQSEKNDYESRFLARHKGVENAHLPVILEAGVTDIKTFSFAPKDIEWLAQREMSRDEVGAVFGVPDEIMGYGKDTYENFQTALKTFWTLTLAPLIRRRDTVLTHHFRRYGWLAPTERVDTDLSDVGELQDDLTPRVELAIKLWDRGVPMDRADEIFGLGIGPTPGGNIGYLPSSLVPIDQVGKQAAAVTPPAPPANDAPDMQEPDADEEPMDDAPPAKTVYLLPEGAKEQAKRALKKYIQCFQDACLRNLRGDLAPFVPPDTTELTRWLGAYTEKAIDDVDLRIVQIKGDHDTVNAAYTELKSDASLSRLLEVAAPAFFTRGLTIPTTGAITHSVYKQLILQLDPDDDEAERTVREALERKLERDLTTEFQAQLTTLLPDDASDDVIRSAASRVEATSEPVREVLRRNLEQSASLGVSIALDTLDNIGFGFDWTLANTDAARWASQYSYELVRGINSTSAARLQVAVEDWFKERTTVGDLIDELTPTFGKRRARTIAMTETTRAATEGSLAGWKAAGYGEGRPSRTAPAHPKCRCWITLRINNDNSAEFIWKTARDERVCPICGSLHNQSLGFAKRAA